MYEFDLKGYFDNVSHEGILGRLKREGWCDTEIKFFGTIMKSIPKLRSEDLTPESDREITHLPSGKLTVNNSDKALLSYNRDYDGTGQMMRLTYNDALLTLMSKEGPNSEHPVLRLITPQGHA